MPIFLYLYIFKQNFFRILMLFIIKRSNMFRKNVYDFIEDAKKVHGNKYDYSKVDYNGCKEKVCIICPEHGEFWQTPDNHLQKKGCPICRYVNSAAHSTLTTDEFVKRAKKIHGSKYDYSNVEYKGNNKKVAIICHEKDENGKEHGVFWQTPTGHIDKRAGCPKCSKNHKYTTEEFMESLPNWIKEKYDFSKFVYKRTHEKSILICPEHGEFLMSPHNIRKGIGCPGCNESKLERSVRVFLKSYGVEYISEYKDENVFGKQEIDFYLPKYGVAIECQGIQHFVPTDFAGKGEEWKKSEFEHIKKLDENKQKLCDENGVKLIYFTSKENSKLANKVDLYSNRVIITEIEDIKNYLYEN